MEACVFTKGGRCCVSGCGVEQRGQEVVGRLRHDVEVDRVDGKVADVGCDDDSRADGDRGCENVSVLRVIGHVRLARGNLGLGHEASGAGLFERVGDASKRAIDGCCAWLSEGRSVALDEMAPGLAQDAFRPVQLEEAGEGVPDEQVALVASVEDVGVDDCSRDRHPRDGTRRRGRYSSSASSSALRIDSRIAACASS